MQLRELNLNKTKSCIEFQSLKHIFSNLAPILEIGWVDREMLRETEHSEMRCRVKLQNFRPFPPAP